METVKLLTKVDNGKLLKVIEYGTKSRVEIPINKDGSIKWLTDKPYKAVK